MNLKAENWAKPSNKQFKRIADIMLYALLLVNPVIVSANFNDETTKWLLFGINMLIVVFKTASKFSSEEPTNPINE